MFSINSNNVAFDVNVLTFHDVIATSVLWIDKVGSVFIDLLTFLL